MVTILRSAGILLLPMRRAQIQLQGQLSVDRSSAAPLSLQIVQQLQAAIECGRVVHGTRLPSTRSLARLLGVSRNTVLTAYDELAARGLARTSRCAATYVTVPWGLCGLDIKSLMREAHYPWRTIVFHDVDGNPLSVSY